MEIHWVDVFASGPLTGNPLAVVMGEELPPAAAMQRFAAELGLSETVFAARAREPVVRIFTPEAEIPLAGHPTVGAAWVLRQCGWIGDEGLLSTQAGPITVRAGDDGASMTRTGPVRRGTADAGELARCLGARATGDAPIWDAGLPQAMLPVERLDDLSPDHAALRALGQREGWAGVSAYVVNHPGDPACAEVRHFAAPIGIDEDPVTGSAAGALGAALSAGRGADLALTVLQGHHMGRAGEVRVSVEHGAHGPEAVTVGGAVVPVMRGHVGVEALGG
jgi:trans-2,3-dihydro-3-hydroxyanthranilate isomerase